MILILTDESDAHAEYVIAKLKDRGLKYYRLNLNVDALKCSYLTFKNGSWLVNSRSGQLHQEDISCVWCRRPFIELSLEETICEDNDFKLWKAEWNQTLKGFYNSIKHLPWLNPLRKAYKGENKYFQMDLAYQIGFVMPETLVSNCKDEIVNFVAQHPSVIMKTMSQEIYKVGDSYQGLYTNKVTLEDLSSFNTEGENPLVFQRYIDKQYEVRYTVVGKQHYVCKIDSQKSEIAKSDWRRYDIPHTPHMAIEAPKNIHDKVTALMESLGLEYGALDFIVDKANNWYFLEINCFGQWLWIEQLSGLHIADGIVDWLQEHNCQRC